VLPVPTLRRLAPMLLPTYSCLLALSNHHAEWLKASHCHDAYLSAKESDKPASWICTAAEFDALARPSQGAAQTAAGILRTDGIRGLYRGFGTVIFGTIPARGVRRRMPTCAPLSGCVAPQNCTMITPEPCHGVHAESRYFLTTSCRFLRCTQTAPSYACRGPAESGFCECKP